MNCEDIRQTMSAELDGEAAEHDLIIAYRHLADCAICRSWRREVLAVHRDFPLWHDEPVPPAVAERLQQHEHQAQHRAGPGEKRIYRIPRPLAWAAAMILTIQVGWASYRLVLPPPPTQQQGESDAPAQIVLTAKDRVSSTVIVHTPEHNSGR